MLFVIIIEFLGAWLSWLERTVHIRKVVGSSPSAPILYLIGKVVGSLACTPARTGESLRAHDFI